jgi:hypothetical protein
MFKRIRAWFAPSPAAETTRPTAGVEDEDSSRPTGVRIDFGDNEFSGANISFGNVTGGSLLQHSGPPPGLEQVEMAPHANEAHLRALEAVLLEQQTILQQQIERFGDHVPPYMILQLIEIQRGLAEIQLKLAQASPPAE